MADQLRIRLAKVFTDAPWLQVSAAQAGVTNGLPRAIPDVRTMTVHQTSGWPTRTTGRKMFTDALIGTPPMARETTQLFISGDGTVMLGMELPRRTGHATFVNGWSIGVETGHPWGNYTVDGQLGPWSMTADGGTGRVALRPMPINAWVPLRAPDSLANPEDDDLPGLKFYVKVDWFSEVAFGVWTTPRYAGPWRQPLRVPEAIYTEQQYRAWALLARCVAEEHLIPRNFSLYPWKSRSTPFGERGDHSMINDAARFRELVLADEGLSRSPRTFGLPADTVPPTAAALEAAYARGVVTAPKPKNTHWEALFNVFRGFHGHGYSGTPEARYDDHDCPGPLFDWHRFARETWDWWWWPFDVNPATPNAPAAARPYSLTTRDGNTPLKEYYWGTPPLTPFGRIRPGIHGTQGSPQTFELPEASRVYAMANGELVAARFPAETTGVSLAFVLVRHEVFHRLDQRPPAPDATPPVFANRIDYDVPPTTVYSLYMHLGRPLGMNFDRVVPENPDWLNRVLARKRECELGVAFRASAAGRAIPNAKWNDRPPGSERRPSMAEGWAADDAALTTFLDRLRGGQVAVGPREADTMPLRILLGDHLGHAGNIGAGRRGVRVELFSADAVSPADFTFTDTNATSNDWTPRAAPGDPVVRYRSEWARTPTGPEALRLSMAGVTDLAQVNWWRDMALATLGAGLEADAHLDPFGLVHHYDLMSFLPWLNRRTWRSEWPKYRATDPAGIPAAPRPR